MSDSDSNLKLTRKIVLRAVRTAVYLCAILATSALASVAEPPKPVLRVDFNGNLDGLDAQGHKVPARSELVQFVPGKEGQAGLFLPFPVQGYAIYPAGYLNPEMGTFSCWVNLKFPSSSSVWLRMILFSAGTQFRISCDRLEWDADPQAMYSSRLGWKAGDWHHVAITWRPNHADPDVPYRYDMAIYADGKAVAFDTRSFRPFKKAEFAIGSFPQPVYEYKRNYELNGAISNLKVYDRALSPAQIAILAGLSEQAAMEAQVPKLPELPPLPDIFSPPVKKEIAALPAAFQISRDKPVFIVLSTKANHDEELAARTIQEYLNRMTGGTFELVRDPAKASVPQLIVGKTTLDEARISIPADLGPQELYLRGDDKRYIIAGGDSKGTVYAASEFLERLGVRWYAPLEEGAYVPKKAVLDLPAGEWRESPGIATRFDMGDGPGDKSDDLYVWSLRMRNSGSYNEVHRHIQLSFADLGDQVFKEHPEYGGMVDGKRRPPPKNNANGIDPCTSNPGVVELIADIAAQRFKENPGIDLVELMQVDGGGWCLCDKCLALDPEPYAFTDRWIAFNNSLAKLLETKAPGKAVRILAYSGVMTPPARQTLQNDNMHVEFCWSAQLNALTNADGRAVQRELLTAWMKLCKHMEIWTYYGYFDPHWSPETGLAGMVWQARELKRLGFELFFVESSASIFTLGVPYSYVTNKVMWNPDADVPEILDDFFKGYYGKAHEPMRKCFDLLERRTIEARTESQVMSPMSIFSPAAMRQCLEWCAQAEKLESDNPWVLRHIRTAKMTYLFAELDRDANLARQYADEKQHPFWRDLAGRRKMLESHLAEGLQIAKELGYSREGWYRGPTPPLSDVAKEWATLLGIDPGLVQKVGL